MKIKALSFRQPWAELIVRGVKTLDLRTWQTSYRGPLAIYASTKVELDACQIHSLDPSRLTTGAVIGVAELAGITQLDPETYQARRYEHLAGRGFKQPMYGWELTDPLPLEQPVKARGYLRLFEVELDGQPAIKQKKGDEQFGATVDSWDPGKPFELRVIQEAAGRQPSNSQMAYRLALFQRVIAPPASRPAPERTVQPMERTVELGGLALRVISDHIMEALRQNGYKPTELSASRREPFLLSEESGVRLGLLFFTVRPLAKVERIEAISHGLRMMTGEEVYYWYSKCTVGPAADRAQKALRVLLAEE